jgi:hypothetical protein
MGRDGKRRVGMGRMEHSLQKDEGGEEEGGGRRERGEGGGCGKKVVRV